MKGPMKKRPPAPVEPSTLLAPPPPPDNSAPATKMVHFEAASILDIGRRLELISSVVVTVIDALVGQDCERDREYALVLNRCGVDPLLDLIQRLCPEETP